MTIRCLHLANLKFSASTEMEQWRDELLDDLVKIDKIIPFDLVVTTGNTVSSGDEASYLHAAIWFEKLTNCLSRVNRNTLFFTPGEMDICRDRVKPLKDYIGSNIVGASKEIIRNMLDSPSEKEILISGFEEYFRFVHRCSDHHILFPWWTKTFQLENRLIGIAGLSANWLAGADPSKDRPILGAHQLDSLFGALKDADFRLLALHQTLESLTDGDREDLRNYAQKYAIGILTSGCDPGNMQIISHNDQCFLNITGSSLAEGEPPAYQYFDYDPIKSKLTFRRHIFNQNWIPDRNTFPPEGTCSYYLGEKKSSVVAKKKGTIDESFVKLYRESFNCFYGQMDLENLGNVCTRETVLFKPPLDKFYQPLRFKRGSNTKPRILEAEQLIKIDSPILIRGNGGTGKTTWIRFSFRQLLRNKNAFPILIEVRQIGPSWRDRRKKGEGFHLIEYIEEQITGQIAGVWKGAVDRVFTAYDGPIPVLLIDGWDEIGDFGEELRRKVHGLQVSYPRLAVIVTSRPYTMIANTSEQMQLEDEDSLEDDDSDVGGIQTEYELNENKNEYYEFTDLMGLTRQDLISGTDSLEFENEQFEACRNTGKAVFDIYDIQPLNEEDVKSLSTQFFKNYYSTNPLKAAQKSVDFLENLFHSQDAAELAKNPLFLTMILFISGTSRLPEKRHQLYDKCIENLLSFLPDKYQDEGVLNERRHDVPTEHDERLRVVSKAAFCLQAQHFNSADAAFSIDFTSEAFADHLPQVGIWRNSYRHNFINWLIDRAGLLIDRADGHISFAHLSFQEFLAAIYLKSYLGDHKDRVNTVMRYSSYLPWWETLRLWLALEHSDNPERIESFCEDAALLESHFVFWFFGTVFADSSSIERPLVKWLEKLPQHLEIGYSDYAHSCASHWRLCKHKDKRKELASKLLTISNDKLLAGHVARFCESAEIQWPNKMVKLDANSDLNKFFTENYDALVEIAGRYFGYMSDSTLGESDLVHEVYLKMINIERRDGNSFYGWFFVICRNIVKKKGWYAENMAIEVDDLIDVNSSSSEAYFDLNMHLEHFLIEKPEAAKIIICKNFLGCTNQEIAVMFKITLYKVRLQIDVGLSWLRNRLL